MLISLADIVYKNISWLDDLKFMNFLTFSKIFVIFAPSGRHYDDVIVKQRDLEMKQ